MNIEKMKEQLKEKIKATMLRRTKSSHTITTLAGAYLLYMVYDMIKLVISGEASGIIPWLGIVLFIAAGLMFVTISGIALSKGLYAQDKRSVFGLGNDDEDSTAEGESVEELSGTGSEPRDSDEAEDTEGEAEYRADEAASEEETQKPNE